MEAPKEIFVPVSNGKISGLWKDVPFNTNDKENVQENIKYIRSDLAGLNGWKPSEEQMDALDEAQAQLCSSEWNTPLCSLIDNLKKL